ncbi:hypothetical protein N7519_003094 [Penicillium mononematosum]|uniref:uncharacterized protein n=1 Tax=Penicillium mononematosum TaxID=268346 RepID=UPI002546C25B|nr:uncharacterized protein N7519_003094 [Penicillium mononematosum]KAJ6188186.1 hypothetical protein N7519_003094 [Penicillium mononematosum]
MVPLGAADPGPATTVKEQKHKNAEIREKHQVLLDNDTQTMSPSLNIATDGLPFLGNMGRTGMDGQFARMIPQRSAIDWRPQRPASDRKARAGNPCALSLANNRAVLHLCS